MAGENVIDPSELSLGQRYEILSAAIAKTASLLQIEPPDFVGMLRLLLGAAEEALVEWDTEEANKTKH